MEEQVTKQPRVGSVDASGWPKYGWNEDEVKGPDKIEIVVP
ncbi:hypothetical protein L195_g024931 [Trifolium pratense]|uniref:Uncharacterized protein n=1 Tax=Trifolium pratense TaxID=57577 RepID=A0A2K3NF19_TRIPR|nr:hypothetical protein L195_g024931 [Trifolium pratense]